MRNPKFDLVRNALATVASATESIGIHSLEAQIHSCRQLSSEKESGNIAVIGSFKAGKSSLLNCLIGSPILPVGVIPITAIVTQVRYGDRESAEVLFLDGKQITIPLSEIESFISEPLNPSNCKKVHSIVVTTPKLAKFGEWSFIDTPGMGSIFAHNTQTSREWLPHIGAALILTSAERPLSHDDGELLKQALHHTPFVAVLLTKADLLNRSDLQMVHGFISNQVRNLGAEKLPVFPFSVKKGWDESRRKFENEFLSQFTSHRQEKQQEIVIHKVRALLSDCLSYLQIGLAAARKKESLRLDLLAQLHREEMGLDRVKHGLILLRSDLLKHLPDRNQKIARGHLHSLHHQLTQEYEQRLVDWRDLNLWRLARQYEAWLDGVLFREMQQISRSEENKFLEPLREAEEAIARYVKDYRTRLSLETEKFLGMQLTVTEWRGDVVLPQKPSIRTSFAFDIGFDLLWFVIPRFIYGPLARRHLRNKIEWEIEKNLSRLAVQWSEAIGKRIEELSAQAENLIEAELSTIENLLTSHSDKLPEMERMKVCLRGQLENLKGEYEFIQ